MKSSSGLALFTIATCIASCGDVDDEGMTQTSQSPLLGTFVPLHYDPNDNRLFRGPYAQAFSNNDWAFGWAKAECGPNAGQQLTTMVGISTFDGGTSCGPFGLGCFRLLYNDVILCSNSSMSIDQFFEERLVASPSSPWPNVQRDTTWGDWAFGLQKLECLPGQAVTAVARNAILCSRVDNFKSPPTGCNTRLVGTQENRPSPNRGDWAIGSYKTECRIGEYIKGMAYHPGDTRVAAILCCTPGR